MNTKHQSNSLLALFTIDKGPQPLAVDLGVAVPSRGTSFDVLAKINGFYHRDMWADDRRIVLTDGQGNTASVHRDDLQTALAPLLTDTSFAKISKNVDRIFTVGRHGGTFQDRVGHWVTDTLGADCLADTKERNHRFLEEALELVQACGLPREEAHGLVNYVYERPAGEIWQEVGGVMATLAALCSAQRTSMTNAANDELVRIWIEADTVKSRQKRKPREFITYANGRTAAVNG